MNHHTVLSPITKIIALCVLITEICIFGLVGYALIIKRRTEKFLGESVPVTRINKNFLIFPQGSKLKYFYEPAADTVQTERAEWLLDDAKYTLNKDSLNERFDYDVEKPPTTFRIITLGDSFTFGQFVNTADNWPEQLEDMFSKSCEDQTRIEVINLGVYGYDMQYSSERFLKRGVKYQPDLVIWFLLGDRINELALPVIAKLERTMSEEEKHVAKKAGDYSPEWTKATKEIMAKYSPTQILEQERLILQEFTASYSGTLIFMVLPNIGSEYKARIKVHALERPNTFVTFKIPDISASGNMHPDGHPNALGHREYANYMYNYLTEQKLIPCNLKTLP